MELTAPSIRTVLFGFVLFAFSGQGNSTHAFGDEPLVLLTNGNVLRGKPHLEGSLVILERDDGSRLRIRRDQVAFSADSLQELYQFRVNKNSFRSAAICADDVAWCLRNGLIDEAEVELAKLKAMDPTYPAAYRMQRQIESMRSPHSSAPIQTVSISEPEVAPAVRFDNPEGISPAAIASFATRVQPMLINRCGNSGCHRTGSDTSWQLSHLGINVRVSSKMTQRNLASTVAFINLDEPYSSPLLRYLMTSHAAGRYGTSGRTAQSAEATLREWLSQLGRYPQPHMPQLVDADAFHSQNPLPTPPVAQTGFSQWPPSANHPSENHPGLAPLQGIRSFGLPSAEEVPEGFSIDDEGEWIYDPEGTFRRNPTPQSIPGSAYEGLVPAGWPAPVIGPAPVIDPALGSPPAGALPRIPIPPAITQPAAKDKDRAASALPKRLPAIENPFSADLFNRQSQLSAAAAAQ